MAIDINATLIRIPSMGYYQRVSYLFTANHIKHWQTVFSCSLSSKWARGMNEVGIGGARATGSVLFYS